MQIEYIPVSCGIQMRITVAADFHSSESDMNTVKTLGLIEKSDPDLIVCPGDIFNHTDSYSVTLPKNQNGLTLLTEMTKIAPVVYSIGNHEHGMNKENKATLAERDIIVLDDSYVEIAGIAVGGLTTGYLLERKEYETEPSPNLGFIDEFAAVDGFKLLLCHHPEYYPKFIRGKGIDLTVSGHAHGGQWRIFSRGVYAPGQGFFPKYTGGVHDFGSEHLAISRGMTNTVPIPRFFNPCEILVLELSEN